MAEPVTWAFPEGFDPTAMPDQEHSTYMEDRLRRAASIVWMAQGHPRRTMKPEWRDQTVEFLRSALYRHLDGERAPEVYIDALEVLNIINYERSSSRRREE